MENMFDRANNIFSLLDNMPINEKIVAINTLKVLLTEHSPFKNEPIDCIQWVPCTEVQKNDYNPNAVIANFHYARWVYAANCHKF